MEKIEIDSIQPLLKGAKPIGYGTTAYCFLLPDNTTLKLYKNNYNSRSLLSFKNFESNLERIAEISNDTYIGPQKLIKKDGKIVGYIYPYIHAKALKYKFPNMKLSEVFKSYDKLLIDTKKISDAKLTLFDLHDKNILFKDKYYIIDLDRSDFHLDDADFIYECNMKRLFYVLLYKIYGLDPWYIITFGDYYFNKFINNIDATDINQIYKFMEIISSNCNDPDPSLEKIRRKAPCGKIYNDHYK